MSCVLCFPGSAKVWINSAGDYLPITNLQSVDTPGNSSNNHTLLTFSSKLKPKVDHFVTYLHYDSSCEAHFLRLICSNGKGITLSGEHLIYTRRDHKTVSVPAKEIKIGDILIQMEPETGSIILIDVVKIVEEKSRGIYAPMTNSGNMIVDGFYVSCYAHVKSHLAAHLAMAPLRLWYNAKQQLKTGSAGGIMAHGIHGYVKTLLQLSKPVPIKMVDYAKAY